MIVTCGEAMVDLIPQGTGEDVIYRPVLGGSLYTVALGIARLGGTAGYLWELSTDTLGERLIAELVAAGVDCGGVSRSSRSTPVAVVDMSGPEPHYAIADPGLVMRDTPLGSLPAHTRCLQVGSAVLARDPVGGEIERVAATAPLVSLDINARPPSIVDPQAYRARLRRLSASSGIVKASSADIDVIGEGDAEEYMRARIEEGAALAILTVAEEGAIAFTRTRTVHRPAVATHIVDPVGAGDSFMAAALSHLQAEDRLTPNALHAMTEADLARFLDVAQTASAYTCARQGAVMPGRADLGWS